MTSDPTAQQRLRAVRSVRALAWLAILLSGPLGADAGMAEKEAAVRAAFLYRLAFFVTWEASAFPTADSPLRFCVVSDPPSPVGTLLRSQAGSRKVNDRSIAVEQHTLDADLSGCHLVYREGASAAPPSAPAQLVVVDSVAALERGGTLALVPETGSGGAVRLGFVSRRDRLPSGGLALSAKLLQLVRFDPAGGGP